MAKRVIKTKKTCRLCGTSFDGTLTEKICMPCGLQVNDYRAKIKEYMIDYPKVTAAQLSLDAEIPMSVIDYLIEEDFFYVTESGGMEFKPIHRCKKCNKSIEGNGRFCDDCLKEIVATEVKSRDGVAQLKQEEPESKDKDRIKFHMASKLK